MLVAQGEISGRGSRARFACRDQLGEEKGWSIQRSPDVSGRNWKGALQVTKARFALLSQAQVGEEKGWPSVSHRAITESAACMLHECFARGTQLSCYHAHRPLTVLVQPPTLDQNLQSVAAGITSQLGVVVLGGTSSPIQHPSLLSYETAECEITMNHFLMRCREDKGRVVAT